MRQVRPVSEANSAPKTYMTMEHRHFLIGDTSSNGCVFIVMLVFWGVTLSFFRCICCSSFLCFPCFSWYQGFKIPSKILQLVIHVLGRFVSRIKFFGMFIQLSGRIFCKKSDKKRGNLLLVVSHLCKTGGSSATFLVVFGNLRRGGLLCALKRYGCCFPKIGVGFTPPKWMVKIRVKTL